MTSNQKRLFFALEVHAPWPCDLPFGRILEENCRHMTLAFLGETHFLNMQEVLPNLPVTPWKVGLVGTFDSCIFLPERHPRVVAWHIKWLDKADILHEFQKKISTYLYQEGLMKEDARDLLPHVTICRAPFQAHQWKSIFSPLPMYVSSLHLYESLGHLQYTPCWTYPILSPFEEIEHTADIGFIIRGENITQIYRHAFTALAFKHTPLLDYFIDDSEIMEIDDVIISLNKIISIADAKIGCPLKAVSLHGDITKDTDQTLTWEMIVDV